MKRISTIVLFVIYLTAASTVADDGGTESPFSFGAGARELALGSAVLTTADPTTAPFWNASLLALAERFSLGGFHTRLYESDVAYQYVGMAVPTMDMGGFGFGLFRLGIEGIEKRDAHNLLLKEIEDNRLALYLAYGRCLSGYNLGMALTLEHHSLDDYSQTSSPGLNLSMSRRIVPSWDWLTEMVGSVNARNIIKPSMKVADENVKYPYSVDAGMSFKLLLKQSWNHSLTLSTRVSKVDWIDPEVAFGLEYGMNQILHLRGGVQDNKLSFGAGLHFKSIKFDYALVERDLGSLHMFSFTLDFGMPISLKRIVREKRREAQFNELMNKRLLDANRGMISTLAKRGEELVHAGELDQASIVFDRALFLARTNGLDTTSVAQLASQTEKKLQEARLRREFQTHIDSAQTKLAVKDYLSAMYFANLALSKSPNSEKAKRLLDQANTEIEQSTTEAQMIESRLLFADSLLSYGKLDEALVVMRALSQIAENDSRVASALTKVEFASWKEAAAVSFSRGEYRLALAAVDSALSRFSEHPWCLNLRVQIEKELNRPIVETTIVKKETPEPLSQKLLQEVSEIYQTGQQLFEEGKLPEAISHWEKVERLAPDYKSVRDHLVRAYKFVGVELYTQNRLQEAVSTWKKAAKLAPSNIQITNYIKRTEHEILKLEELSYDDK
jgi:tetratricopeptide (TPR) repeat protein